MGFGYYDHTWVEPDPEPDYEPEYVDCFIIEEKDHDNGKVYREFLTYEEAEEWHRGYLETSEEYTSFTVKCWSGWYDDDGNWDTEELVWELVFD